MKIQSFPPAPLLSPPVARLVTEYRSLSTALAEARAARDRLTDDRLDVTARTADVATLTAAVRKTPGKVPAPVTDGAVAALAAQREAAALHISALDAALHDVGNAIAAATAKVDRKALIAQIDNAQAAVIGAGDGLAEAVSQASTAAAMLTWMSRVENSGPTDDVTGAWSQGASDVALNLHDLNHGDPSAPISLGALLSTLEAQVAAIRGQWSL